jgi:AraC-like DNA-binding protein
LADNGNFLYFFGMNAKQQALRFQQRFLRRIGGALHFADLFENIPIVVFYARDETSRFVRANKRLVEILGCRHEWEVIGKTDFDFRPAEVAAVFIEDDRRVMRTGRTSARYIRMVPDVAGLLHWWSGTKMPLRDTAGRVCGVVGAMYELHEIHGVLQPFTRIEPALRHLHTHYREPITTGQLAELVHWSESQFVRQFRGLLGEPPMHYLVRQRLHAACQELIATDKTAGEIALDCGFYDQSAFTRAFRVIIGSTPQAYRRHFRKLAIATAPTRLRLT